MTLCGVCGRTGIKKGEGALSQVLRFLKKFYSLKYKIYNLVTNRTALSHPTSAISIRCDVMPVVPMPDIGSFWSTKVHTVQLRSQTLKSTRIV